MKNKRSKNSIFYDSTKNKHRKQEQKHNLQEFNQKSFSSSTQMTTPITQKQAYFSKNSQSRNPASVATLLNDEAAEPMGSHYTYEKGKAKKTYLYDFTNSRFIYFIGTLEPKPYLIFITLIALILTEDLNETEAKIVCAFILNTADTMLTLVEQEVILNNYKQKKESRELGNALHHDFKTIYAELNSIKKKFKN